jgi:hypothetical protein
METLGAVVGLTVTLGLIVAEGTVVVIVVVGCGLLLLLVQPTNSAAINMITSATNINFFMHALLLCFIFYVLDLKYFAGTCQLLGDDVIILGAQDKMS